MPFVDARLGPGTLTLGTTPLEFGFQVSSIAVTPSTDETDGTPTLAVPDPAPEMTTSYTLDGSAIADFSSASGLNRYAWDHDGEEVAFVWTPNTEDATPAMLSGTVQMRAFPIGGAVGEQVVTDFSWPTIGRPDWTGGAATQAARGEKVAK